MPVRSCQAIFKRINNGGARRTSMAAARVATLVLLLSALLTVWSVGNRAWEGLVMPVVVIGSLAAAFSTVSHGAGRAC
jgi:fatty acid desaturase